MSKLNIISSKQVCMEMGVTRSTIKRWIKNRNFPKPLAASGRSPLFDEADVIAWLGTGESNND